MDINDLRGLATLFAFIGFLTICFWAYSSKRKTAFDEASLYPFIDQDQDTTESQSKTGHSKSGEQH